MAGRDRLTGSTPQQKVVDAVEPYLRYGREHRLPTRFTVMEYDPEWPFLVEVTVVCPAAAKGEHAPYRLDGFKVRSHGPGTRLTDSAIKKLRVGELGARAVAAALLRVVGRREDGTEILEPETDPGAQNAARNRYRRELRGRIGQPPTPEQVRQKAVVRYNELIDAGEPGAAVVTARELGISRASVFRYVREAREQEGLRPRSEGGTDGLNLAGT